MLPIAAMMLKFDHEIGLKTILLRFHFSRIAVRVVHDARAADHVFLWKVEMAMNPERRTLGLDQLVEVGSVRGADRFGVFAGRQRLQRRGVVSNMTIERARSPVVRNFVRAMRVSA